MAVMTKAMWTTMVSTMMAYIVMVVVMGTAMAMVMCRVAEILRCRAVARIHFCDDVGGRRVPKSHAIFVPRYSL